MKVAILQAAVLAALTLVGCGGDNELDGGVLATFAVGEESFSVWVTNEDTIEQLLALEAGESQANIPNGWIEEGSGQGDHNEPWTWHLSPTDITMEEVTIELCDGTPSHLEENLREIMGTAGRFCPWSAELTDLEDHR